MVGRRLLYFESSVKNGDLTSFYCKLNKSYYISTIWLLILRFSVIMKIYDYKLQLQQRSKANYSTLYLNKKSRFFITNI